MKITQRFKSAINAFAKTENSASNPAHDFLRYGNRNQPVLKQDWSQVDMSDQDMYTGYAYAVINRRANRAAVLGKHFLLTEADKKVMERAKDRDEEVVHPYLKLIRESKEFSEKRFWHDISTYLDLEGVYYLMAVRAVGQNRDGSPKVGQVQYFQMLNPYQVRRIKNEKTGELGGYVEHRDGLYREIPKEMIIEIRLLNPFNNDKPYSMTDAAKDNQFTLKQAGDYTRKSIQGNINAPGIISTDVILTPENYANFIERVRNRTKGEPIYGNGAKSVTWEPMQVDLDKAGLDTINEINRSTLFAVSGVSKTIIGIEESGTTRDTSQVQKDNFTENAIMPQIEDIVDALNLDYKKWYKEYENNKFEIIVDNPLESDREAELKDIEIRTKQLEISDALVNAGYEPDLAYAYAKGEITVDQLGQPTLEPELSDEEAEELAAAELGLIKQPRDTSTISDDTSATDKPAPAKRPTSKSAEPEFGDDPKEGEV